MKYALFILLFGTVQANAETINCDPIDSSDRISFSVETTSEAETFNVDWRLGKLTRFFDGYRQQSPYIVVPTSRSNNLVYFAQVDRTQLKLNLGPYNQAGVYPKAMLEVPHGGTLEKHQLSCEVKGSVPFVNYCTQYGSSHINAFLFSSIHAANSNLVEAAMECGAQPTAKDSRGCTTLLALADGNCGTGRAVVKNYGLDVDENETMRIFNVLSDNGALLDSKDPVTKQTPLQKFVLTSTYEPIDMLIQLEADVNNQDINGNTPLMNAAMVGDTELVQDIDLVELLIEGGANVAIKNNRGQTAYDIAKAYGHNKLLDLLAEPAATMTLEGKPDGTCAPLNVEIKSTDVSKLILKATSDKMFKMVSRKLGIEIMADRGESSWKNIIKPKAGTYEFTCGVHNAPQQSVGQIIVK